MEETSSQIGIEVWTILYLGDQSVNLDYLQSSFDQKIKIVSAHSGEEGLKILEKQPIQMVIANQKMPGQSGAEFLRKVKNKWPELKCILFAEYDDNVVIREVDNEVVIHWYKEEPFDKKKLQYIIKREIEASRSDYLLRKSEQKFKDAFNSMSDVFTRSDLNGICVMVSPSIYNISGYKQEEILGTNFADYYADPKQRIEVVNKLQKTKNVENLEIDIVKKDGSTITISTNAKLYYNSKGEPLGVESVFRDITDRRRAEKDREKLLHDVGERLKELNCMYTISNSIRRRETLEEIFQDTVDAIPPAWHYPEITRGKIHYNDREWVSEPFKDTAWKQSSDIIINGQKLGVVEAYYLEESPILNEGPFMKEERDLMNSIAQTLTEAIVRKQAEEKLLESEEKFRTLVTSTEEIIFMIARDGTFLLSEGKGLAKIGLKPGEVVGKSVFELYKDYPAMLDKIRLAINGESITTEAEIGKNFFKSWYTPHFNQVGEIIGLLGLSINITEQKKTELQVLEYQKRLKELAHEVTITEERVRKQIAVDLHDNVSQLLVFSRMQLTRIIDLEENPEKEGKIKNVSQALLKATQATRSAIFDLSPPQLNEIGLSAAIDDWVKEQVERKYNISTSITGEEEKFKLEEDTRFLLFRSIKELIINVVKHARAKRLKVDFKRNGDMLEITVEDNGIGFTYNPDLHKLNNNIYGLFSIQERMSDLGGSIIIDSVLDKGTKAQLVIPLKAN